VNTPALPQPDLIYQLRRGKTVDLGGWLHSPHPIISLKTNFGHFIAGWNEFHFSFNNSKNILFSFLAAGGYMKNLAIARKKLPCPTLQYRYDEL